MVLTEYFENKLDISSPKNNQITLDFPVNLQENLIHMNIATNLPELPTNEESKFKETVKENMQFLKSLLYLTKKIFMLV